MATGAGCSLVSDFEGLAGGSPSCVLCDAGGADQRAEAADTTDAGDASRMDTSTDAPSRAPVTFSGPIPLSTLDNPTVTSDGLTLYAHGQTFGAAINHIYLSTRNDAGMPFGVPSYATELNSSYNDGDALLSADGNVIYFASSRNAGPYEIYRAVKNAPTAFGPPALLPMGAAGFPVASADELTLFFGSNRMPGGAGGQDIWRASRTTTTLYFTSARGGVGLGGLDIWSTTRPK